MFNKKLFITSLCILCICGCARSDGRYEVLSDRPLALQTLINDNTKVANTKAISRRHVVIVIPFSKAPTLSDAIEAALQQYKGDYLANVEVRQINAQLMFWYHYKAWEISGTVMRIKR